MSLNSLLFSLLLAAVIGGRAVTLTWNRINGSVTNEVTLDSRDVNVESKDNLTIRTSPDVIQDVSLPPGITQGDMDRLQANAGLTLVDLNKYPLARCMDGSAAGYYWKHASTETAKNNWIIHLEGGGECDTSIRCLALKLTPLGTSNLFSQNHSFYGEADVQVKGDRITVSTNSLLNSRKSLNPEFCDWNMVFIPYCSQDLWVGQQTEISQDTLGVYFSGRHILDAIFDILDREGMDRAKNLVFSGDSAGGYGVFANVDRLALSHPGARTVGNPIGGLWTYAYPYTGPGHTYNKFSDFREPNWPRMKEMWNAYYNEDCATEPNRNNASCMVGCSLAPFPWTHIKSPLFITEANSDSILSTMHNWIPDPPTTSNGMHDPNLYNSHMKAFLEQFGHNMTQCLKEGVDIMHAHKKFNIGIFSPSCFVHTDFSNILINGRSYVAAFADFFFERGEPPVLIEDGFLTNPSCSNQLYSLLS